MNGDIQSKWFTHALTVGFIVAMLLVFVSLLTQSDSLAFADIADTSSVAQTAGYAASE